MKYALVEKKNHLAVHALFDSVESAERHLQIRIPKYVAKSYFMDKSLTVDSFEIIKYEPKRRKCPTLTRLKESVIWY